MVWYGKLLVYDVEVLYDESAMFVFTDDTVTVSLWWDASFHRPTKYGYYHNSGANCAFRICYTDSDRRPTQYG